MLSLLGPHPSPPPTPMSRGAANSTAGLGEHQTEPASALCPPPFPPPSLQIAEVPKPEFMARTLEELQIGTYSNIAVVSTSTPIYVALGIFVQHRVSALPVVDDSGKALGAAALCSGVHAVPWVWGPWGFLSPPPPLRPCSCSSPL